jgi:hypothetical protein
MAISSKTRPAEAARVTVNFLDSIDLIHNQIHWTPKGVSLLTKWAFAEGTEVEFAFEHQGERHCCAGVVVSCHALRRPAGYFEVVLFFVDTPCLKLQKAACDCRLARNQEMSQSEDRYLNTPDGSARFAPRFRSRAVAG